MLPLADYRDVIELDEPFPVPKDDPRTNYHLLMTALSGLRNKHYTGTSSVAHLSTDEGLLRWLEAELSVREPGPIDPITSRAINTLLYRHVGKHGRVEAMNLRRVSEMIPNCDYGPALETVLYTGDMRQLVVDAVVNTATPGLDGCPIPLHDCLDSVLHQQAGPWMRNDTNTIREIAKKDALSPGDVVMTRGYRLPAKYVIHTTGPVVKNGRVTDKNRRELFSCYWNALDLAHEKGDIKSIAFPAISTGINGFPMEEANDIALRAVEKWMYRHDQYLDLVVFSVRTETDADCFMEALETWVEE
ncbi:MAG: Appr-1-p processing protein [Actinomycetaceae bacterium]|nr:Appr-1-p processing protein [Actinomycetaceae bacterium]